MIVVSIVGHVPDDLVQEFLQAVQTFNAAHVHDVELQVMLTAPEMSGEEIHAMLDALDPPIPYRVEFFTGGKSE